LPIRIPPIVPQSSSSLSSIIWGWHNRPNSGHSTKWTKSHPMRKIKSNKVITTVLQMVCEFSCTTYLLRIRCKELPVSNKA
jgi:hypothetical protein